MMKQYNHEDERIAALKTYQILDTDEEADFDQLNLLALQICGAKTSVIGFSDAHRIWFKSRIGTQAKEIAIGNTLDGHLLANLPLIDNEGHTLGVLSVLNDQPQSMSALQMQGLRIISSQVIAQLRLRRELSQKADLEKKLARLSSNTPGVIFQFQLHRDGSANFPFASTGINEVYEVTPEELQLSAKKVFKRLHPEDYKKVVNSMKKSAMTLESLSLDYRVILPKAGLRWLRAFARPEKLSDQSTLWHGFISDVTDEKNLEARFFHNSKLSALDEMARSVAHEINNPLSIIVGKTSLLNSHLDGATWNREKIISDIKKIESTALRVSNIIKVLTAISRSAEHDSFTVTKVKKIIEDALSLVHEKFKYRSIEIHLDCPEELYVECNSTQIGQVLMNLLINSFDAIKKLDKKWIRIEVKSSAESVQILVSDSGEGISPKITQKIMQPFFTTKCVAEGTGLGLSLSKDLVDSHNGKLEYIPNNKNTTFLIELPIKGKSTFKNVA